MAAKREWFERSFPGHSQRAEQEIIAADKRRAAVIKRFFNLDWCARGHYHMLLNAGVGTEGMIDAVLAATRLRAPEPVGTGQ